MKRIYKSWPVHNLLAHPLMELLHLISFGRLEALGNMIHDATLPDHTQGEGRGGARMSEDLKEDLCTLQRNTKGRDRGAYFGEALRLYGLTREELKLMIREDHEFYMGMVEAYFESNHSELSDLPCINGYSWEMPD